MRLQASGMPVPKGTNLAEASRRFVLTGVSWRLLD
jgi:hypothetical protein